MSSFKNNCKAILDDFKQHLSLKQIKIIKRTYIWGKRLLIAVLLWFIFVVCFVTHLEPTEDGIGMNWLNGELRLLERNGWHITPPWVWVAKVQTTPMRVSVSTASRGYSAKLVQFNSEHYEEFIKTEGWYFYWWYNRLSFNIGYDRNEEYRGFRDVMRAYAYSAKKYPFITLLKEYEAE